MVVHRAGQSIVRASQSCGPLFTITTTFGRDCNFLYPYKMPINSEEVRINLIIDTLCINPTISIRYIVKIYEVSQTTIIVRMNGRTSIDEIHNSWYQLTLVKEETFVQYILDLDLQRFVPRINNIENIANFLFAMHYTKPIGIR